MTSALAASRTAMMVAAYRGRASAAADPVCSDPWALRLAGPEGEALSRRWDAHSPSMELWVALRTRYLDDCVSQALDRGFRQVVILGAGLDTRAARLWREGVVFFELDQPATQADKRERISRFEGYPADPATFVQLRAGVCGQSPRYDRLLGAFSGRRTYAIDLPGRAGSDGPPLATVAEMEAFPGCAHSAKVRAVPRRTNPRQRAPDHRGGRAHVPHGTTHSNRPSHRPLPPQRRLIEQTIYSTGEKLGTGVLAIGTGRPQLHKTL